MAVKKEIEALDLTTTPEEVGEVISVGDGIADGLGAGPDGQVGARQVG